MRIRRKAKHCLMLIFMRTQNRTGFLASYLVYPNVEYTLFPLCLDARYSLTYVSAFLRQHSLPEGLEYPPHLVPRSLPSKGPFPIVEREDIARYAFYVSGKLIEYAISLCRRHSRPRRTILHQYWCAAWPLMPPTSQVLQTGTPAWTRTIASTYLPRNLLSNSHHLLTSDLRPTQAKC